MKPYQIERLKYFTGNHIKNPIAIVLLILIIGIASYLIIRFLSSRKHG